jgi:hypothetical protein
MLVEKLQLPVSDRSLNDPSSWKLELPDGVTKLELGNERNEMAAFFALVAKQELGNARLEAPASRCDRITHPCAPLYVNLHFFLALEAGASVSRYQAGAW